MATLRATITLALRRLGVLGPGQRPDAQQEEDAVAAANRLLRGLVGLGLSHPVRHLETDQSVQLSADWPAQRLLCMVGGITIQLPPRAADGARIIILDVNGLAAASPITVTTDGPKIEGAASPLSLNTAGVDRALMFRADLGDWRRVSDLTIDDILPFPDDLEEAWTITLMNACESLFDAEMRPSDARMIAPAMKRFRARYMKPWPLRPDSALGAVGGPRNYAVIAQTGDFSS